MQKGSSSKTDTQTVNQSGTTALTGSQKGGASTTYAPWIEEAQKSAIGLANYLTQGKTGDNLVAALNPDQQAAFGLARDTASQFGAGNTNGQYFMDLLGRGTIKPTDYREHMNPYLADVGKAAVNDMRREHENAQTALSARYAARGGLGGSGEGFARARLTRGLNEAVPGVIANIMSGGYDRAQGVAAQNAQNALAAAGLYDRYLSNELARQIGATGLLGEAGAAQQQHAQKKIDAPYEMASWYQSFIPQVYDSDQSSWSDTESLSAQEMLQSTKSKKASPSLMQQLLGLGGSILTSKDASGGTVGGSLLKSLLGN